MYRLLCLSFYLPSTLCNIQTLIIKALVQWIRISNLSLISKIPCRNPVPVLDILLAQLRKRVGNDKNSADSRRYRKKPVAAEVDNLHIRR